MQTESNTKPKNKKDHDIYTDPAIADAREVPDPLAVYIKENWLHIVVGVAAVLCAFWIYETLQSTKVNALRGAADAFSGARQQYISTISSLKPGETMSLEQQDRLRAQLVTVRDTRPPYDAIAQLYLTLIGDLPKESSQSSWNELPVEDRARFIKELEALYVARNHAAEKDTREQGLAELFELADGAHYMSAAAIVSLNSLELDAEQREQLRISAETAVEKLPEIRKDLEAAGVL